MKEHTNIKAETPIPRPKAIEPLATEPSPAHNCSPTYALARFMRGNVLKGSMGSSLTCQKTGKLTTNLSGQSGKNVFFPSSKLSLGKTVAKAAAAIVLCCVLQFEARAIPASITVLEECASPIVTNIGSSLTVTGAVCNT